MIKRKSSHSSGAGSGGPGGGNSIITSPRLKNFKNKSSDDYNNLADGKKRPKQLQRQQDDDQQNNNCDNSIQLKRINTNTTNINCNKHNKCDENDNDYNNEDNDHDNGEDNDEQDDDDDDDDENDYLSYSLPLPIQTFLWRQTSPFIRPKISKLQDAAAMEQREACKLFEKVLVQNIRFGLSPSLTKAIASVSRWRLIVSALPHVMHCCSTLLYIRRKMSFDKLSASETKLLYTLHWILLDAAEECADEENELQQQQHLDGIKNLIKTNRSKKRQKNYILPLTTIQTFIYLFAPLIPHLKQSDFLTSFRLENGYKIWIPLFNYCHPEIPSFLTYAKQNTLIMDKNDQHNNRIIPKFGDVFIGSSCGSNDIDNNSSDQPSQQQQQQQQSDRKDSYTNDIFNFGSPSPQPPPSTQQQQQSEQTQPSPSSSTAAKSMTKTEELKKKYEYQKKDLNEPTMATYLDVAVLRCLFISQWIEDGIDWSLNFLYHRLECIEKKRKQNLQLHNHFYLLQKRSYSLPILKRRNRFKTDNDKKISENNKHRQANENQQQQSTHQHSPQRSQHEKEKESKLKTFKDVRRSSFSGLPGLSGFQALISGTTSSASIGRHGSEKVKHKKSKKHNQQHQLTSISDDTTQELSPKSSATKHYSQSQNQKISDDITHHDSKSQLQSHSHKLIKNSFNNKLTKHTIRDYGVLIQKHLHHHHHHHHQSRDHEQHQQQPQRPASANSFNNKKRKISLSTHDAATTINVDHLNQLNNLSHDEIGLIHRNDLKGKSMPTLHLIANDTDIDIGDMTDNNLDNSNQCCMHLSPESLNETTPSQLSLNDVSINDKSINDKSIIDHTDNSIKHSDSKISLPKQLQQSSTKMPLFPIITITEHSPVSSLKFFNNHQKRLSGSHMNVEDDDNVDVDDEDDDDDIDFYDHQSFQRRRKYYQKYQRNSKFYIDDDDDDDEDENDDHNNNYGIQSQYTSAYTTIQPYCLRSNRKRSSTKRSSTLLLSKSLSDGQIDYTIETINESIATINYVNKNGQLNLTIILKAIHSLSLKDSICSIRVCKMIFKILQKLMSFKLITKRIGNIYKHEKYHKTMKPNLNNQELSIHHLFMDTLFHLIKQLGCSRGCGEGKRDSDAVKLKESIMKQLKSLYVMSDYLFIQYLEMLITNNSIQEIMDIFHSFFSFCSENHSNQTNQSSLMINNSQQQQLQPSNIGQKSSNLNQKQSFGKNGYFNNFGQGFPQQQQQQPQALAVSNLNQAAKAKIQIDAIIIKHTFKSFINRLVYIQKELKVQENMSLYCEIRQFISYVRDNHGGIFRNAALSGLIESTKFIMQNDRLWLSKLAIKDISDQQQQQQPLNQQQINQQQLSSSKSIMNDDQSLSRIVKHKKWGANRTKSINESNNIISNQDLVSLNQKMDLQSSTPATTASVTAATTPIATATTSINQSKLDFLGIINNDLIASSNLAQQHQSPEYYSNQENSLDNQNYHSITSNNNNDTQSQLALLMCRGSFGKQPLKGFSSSNVNQPASYSSSSGSAAINNQKSTFHKARKQFKNVFSTGIKSKYNKQQQHQQHQNSFDDTPDLSRKNSLQQEYQQQQHQQQESDFIVNTNMSSIGNGFNGQQPMFNMNNVNNFQNNNANSNEYNLLSTTDLLTMKKLRTIMFEILKDGMLKFQFLLDSCTPGTIPDAQLVAAMLDLKAPVLARAAFLLECCHFVHRCNRGQWPSWMKMNFNFFRPSGPRHGSQTVVKSRASITLQKYAGRCFYQWAELLSSRLEDLLQNDINTLKSINNDDEQSMQQQQQSQEDDDFLSVSCIEGKEGNCPFALKIVACQLLYEITTYLRETHQYLLTQNSRRTSMINPALVASVAAAAAAGAATTGASASISSARDSKIHTIEPPKPHHQNRRWSMALSGGIGHFFDHMSSTTTAAAVAPASSSSSNDRRISFVLHEAEIENDANDSLIGSNDDFMHQQQQQQHIQSQYNRKRLSQIGPTTNLIIRSGSGGHHESFRRRSIKLKKNDNNSGNNSKKNSIAAVTKLRSSTLIEDDYLNSRSSLLFKRSNSLRSKRKVSGQSEKSDTSDRYSGEESPSAQYGDEFGHSFESSIFDSNQNQNTGMNLNNFDTSDIDMVENIPWLKLITLFQSFIDFECKHDQQQQCKYNCHKKLIQSSALLTMEVKKIYAKDIQASMFDFEMLTRKLLDDKEDVQKKEKKLKKILLGHQINPLSSSSNAIVSANMGITASSTTLGGTMIVSTAAPPPPSQAITTASSSSSSSSPLKRKTSGIHLDSKYIIDHHQQPQHIDLEYGYFNNDNENDPRLIFNDILNYRFESKYEENSTMLYILNQVKNPFHSLISMMLKSALILNRIQYEYLLKISWNLILDDDIQISSSASVAIIVCSLKCPDIVINLLNDDLNNENVDVRIDAINKFLHMWCNRHQCWQRLEEGAHLVLKLPPAAIEFTIPSPRIALECKPVVDPPYMPIVKTKVDEVAINQEPSIQKSFVAATKTRRKQQIELISKALQDQEDKLREERENYRFNSVPVTLQAAYEPVLFHTIDDHDDQDDDVERIPLHHLQVAQCFFPSSLTTASFWIVNLLEDTQINSHGQAVHDVANKTIWHCLSEDSALFLRNLLEKLTREKKNVVIQTIRRLIRFIPRLPAQAAFTLYNYLIGFIMYHVRTPTEDSQSIIASVMSILWLIVPNVFGLFLKDLKQILRKEQCDSTILITANVPSAKKIIVHGPDPGSIPSQFPVHEDTQFSQILTDSLDFFGIDDSKHNEYFLVDTKTNQIHNLNAFVRDFYFFKRSQYPQISLVHMNPIEAYDKFQRQAFILQFTELGKCLMSLSLIKTSYMGIQRVLFLHEELMKLPSFPRKALETNLTLYSGPMGREVLGIDTLHKISWVKLVARMFEATSGFFADSTDIHLFLNVINGTLLLHCEDAQILRLCMATYINAAHQFKNIFATNGYLLIVQTIVQIYGTHQTNSLLCRTIEFVFKQFYILHSKPFVLQMFGAVAPLLDSIDNTSLSSTSTTMSTKYESPLSSSCQISPKAFFQLLQSLGQYTADPLDILELVDAEKPLKALDFCYQMDSETLTVLDSISLCVTVISYAPDSERGHQMLTILDSILPFHLMHMQTLTTKKETPGGPRAELSMIHNISVCIKTLIYNCEALTRNFTGPQRTIDIRETSVKNLSPHIEIDEDSHSKYNADSYYPPRQNRIELDDGELCRLEFRKPRDLLLKIVSEFLTKSTQRFAELSKKINEIHQKNSSYELLDVKCHIRLAEIAHSLLKLAPYDPQTMACKGLVRYMNEILPNSEWRQESMRPALIMVLRRLDKTFTKISKKSAIKRTTDWEAARRLLKGVYLTFARHPYIVHLPHLKSLINVCQNIIIGGDQSSYFLSESSSSAVASWTTALSQAPPPGFTSVAVRLISLQMIQLGDSQSLETICSGAFSSAEKSEIYLMNMIYSMCIRTTSGMKDTPKFRLCDINFVLNVILNILKPSSQSSMHHHHQTSSTIAAGGSATSAATTSTTFQSALPSTSNIMKSTSSATKGSDSSQIQQLKQYSLQQIGFLGLKILITCFEKQLNTEWYHIARCIRDLAYKPHLIGSTFWNFIDFVVTYRTPLFILILPYIKCKYLLKNYDNSIESAYQSRVREKLNGNGLPFNRSKGNLYVSLVNEMKLLREDIIRRKNNPNIDEHSKSIVPDANSASDNKAENSGTGGGGHRLSFAFTQLAASASKLSNISSSMQPATATISTNNQQQQQSQQGAHQQPSSSSSTTFVDHSMLNNSSPTITSSSIKPRVLRGLSFRLSSDSKRLAQRGLSVKLASNQSDKRMFSRRTSYPDHPDVDELTGAIKQPTGSEPKLFRRLTSRSKHKSSISSSGEQLAEQQHHQQQNNQITGTIPGRKETSFTSITNNNNKDDIKRKQQHQQQQQQQNQSKQSTPAIKKSFRFKTSNNRNSISSDEHSSSTTRSIEKDSGSSDIHDNNNSSSIATTKPPQSILKSSIKSSSCDYEHQHNHQYHQMHQQSITKSTSADQAMKINNQFISKPPMPPPLPQQQQQQQQYSINNNNYDYTNYHYNNQQQYSNTNSRNLIEQISMKTNAVNLNELNNNNQPPSPQPQTILRSSSISMTTTSRTPVTSSPIGNINNNNNNNNNHHQIPTTQQQSATTVKSVIPYGDDEI